MLIDELTNDIDMYLGYSNLLDDKHKVVFLTESESNINFLIDVGAEKYIFRLSKNSQLGLRNQIKYEYDALKILEKSYVTPRTFFLDDSTTFFDYGVLIMQYIKGRRLEYQRDFHEVAKTFGKIHSLNLDKIDVSNFIVRDDIIDDCLEKSRVNLKKFFKSPKIDANVKIKINDFLEWGEKNKKCKKFFEKDKWQVINNTEPHLDNFVISDRNRKAYLLDWEKPVIADPSIELSYFLSPVTTMWTGNYAFSEDEKDDFFKTYIMYLDKRDRDIVERVKIYTPYICLKELSKLANRLLVYENDTGTNKDINEYKKLKEYINIEFMEYLTKNYNL